MLIIIVTITTGRAWRDGGKDLLIEPFNVLFFNLLKCILLCVLLLFVKKKRLIILYATEWKDGYK